MIEQTLTHRQLIYPGDNETGDLQCLAYIDKLQELLFAFGHSEFTHSRVLHSLKIISEVNSKPRDVYTCRPHSELYNVCHVPETNTLIVNEFSEAPTSHWLVPLSMNPHTDCWQADPLLKVQVEWKSILCSLSDARVLCWELHSYSPRMALYRVHSPGRIELLNYVQVDKDLNFDSLAATRSIDTLVALNKRENHLIILCGLYDNKLSKLSAIDVPEPVHILWIDGLTLLATLREDKSRADTMADFEVKDNKLVCRREKRLSLSDAETIECWCLMENKLAVFDRKSRQLQVYPYSPL